MTKIFPFIKKQFLTKIRYQMVLLLFGVIVLPILTIQLVNIYTTSESTLKKNQAILNENLLLSKELLNTKLLAYRDIFFSISTNSDFIENVEALNDTTTDTMIYRRISDALDTCITTNILLYPEIQAVGVIGANQEPYIYAQKRQQFMSVMDYFDNHYLELDCADSTDYKLKVGTVPSSASDDAYASPSFYICANCVNYEKMTPMGTLILFINPEKLNETINNVTSEVYDYTSRTLMTAAGDILCDKTGNSGKNWNELEEYAFIDFSSLPEQADFHKDQTLLSASDTDYFNLKLVNIVDYTEMNRSLIIFWPIIIGITIFILILSLFITYYVMGRRFILPIEQIATAMKSVDKTHLDNRFRKIRNDELGDIERSYNEMLIQIKSLLEENQRQTEHLLEMNNQACTAELKSLELQINPHFIFNTLDTINWTAIADGSMAVSEQLNCLASILRYTVYNINQIVPVSQDIEWIEQYLQLQRTRFHNSFSYHIYAEPDALHLKIHKLLLQPFLENSLIHGFDQIPYAGDLQVQCHIISNRYLRIQVTDNGCGIPPEKLANIRRLFSPEPNDTQDFSDSIGLSNIVYRTRKYYPGSRLMVASQKGRTCFKLFIPIDEME